MRYLTAFAVFVITGATGCAMLERDPAAGLLLLGISAMALGIWVWGLWLSSPERWRHKARGTTYSIVDAQGVVQTSTPLVDYDIVVIYRDEKTGRHCVRLPSEFMDGRFERL